MIPSFASSYRNNDSGSESESSLDVIEGSSSDVSFVKITNNKTMNGNNVKTVIPDSDEGSDTEIEEDSGSKHDESIIPPIRRRNAKPNVISDTESDESDFGEKNALSKATRLSIHGLKLPGSESDDDSDFIVSDEDNKSGSSDVSVSDLPPNPHVGYYQSPKSPVYENSDVKDTPTPTNNISNIKIQVNIDLTHNASVHSDVEIIKNDNSVVALSSGDESGLESTPTSPISIKKTSFGSDSSQPKITTFVKDYTYPNSGVKYVSKQVRENELNKLNGLKVDLQKVKYLLESMNLSTLPDKGRKLQMRAEELAAEIKKQAESVANLVVETGNVTQETVKNDGFFSWDDIKSKSKAVQPNKFGAQALNTHMAQRTMTLESLAALHKSLESRPAVDVLADNPRGLKTQLMPHQLHALAWLKWRETQKPRGGILADDMGLGKTLTMISLVVDAKENNLLANSDEDDNDDRETAKKKSAMANGGTLVVCPASLLKQWYNEVNNHCKKHLLKAHIHHGLKREVSNYKLAQNDIVITTYNLVMRELDKSGTLTRVKWERVILDEAHIVRNYKSQTARAVFQLTSKTRWCLTGTPLHNKDLDLFALLKFIRCEPFDDIVLWKKWIDNKSTGGQERLFLIMKTLMLRRTKQELQKINALGCLPDKNINLIEVEMPKDEMNVYQKVLFFSRTLFAQFLHQRAERNNSFSRNKECNEEYFRMHKKMIALSGAKPVKSHEILVLLLRLRQICCHPGLIHAMLVDDEYEGKLDLSQGGTMSPEVDLLGELAKLNIDNDGVMGTEEEEELNENSESQTVSEAMSKVLKSSNPVFNLERKSAKISAVLECLKENVFVHKGDKAVVVSQWTSMLDIVEGHLKCMGVKCSTLSGKVPVAARQDIVIDFNNPNSEIQVLLLSLCAGGVGLNLIGGNHLLLLDLHWNPQLEAQAQDRIYRVGQKKSVYIYKFMCTSTVEQTIKMIQDKKLAMAESVLTGSLTVTSSKLTIEDIKLMFNMT